MAIRDIFGMILCGAGVAVGTVGYRLLGLQWYFGACGLILVGVAFIWSEARDRKLRELGNDGLGDWGDRHYTSGASSTDGADFDGDGED